MATNSVQELSAGFTELVAPFKKNPTGNTSQSILFSSDTNNTNYVSTTNVLTVNDYSSGGVYLYKYNTAASGDIPDTSFIYALGIKLRVTSDSSVSKGGWTTRIVDSAGSNTGTTGNTVGFSAVLNGYLGNTVTIGGTKPTSPNQTGWTQFLYNKRADRLWSEQDLLDGVKLGFGLYATPRYVRFYQARVYALVVPVWAKPTITYPVNGGQYTSPTPSVTIKLPPNPSQYNLETLFGEKMRGFVDISQDPTFDNGGVALYTPIASFDTTHTLTVASNLALRQGTWYLKASAENMTHPQSVNSGDTNIITFTISHAPSATGLNPAGGAVLLYSPTTRFSWSFTDPYAADTQSAYQIIVERNDTGDVIVDTGEVISTLKYADLAIPGTVDNVQLRWKIRLWDADGVAGEYSGYNIIILADPPTVAVTLPTKGQVDVGSGAPIIQWTYTPASAEPDRVQAKYSITFTRSSDGAVVFKTGDIVGPATSYTPQSTILANHTDYSVKVVTTDAIGLFSQDVTSFTTNYPAPDDVTYLVDETAYQNLGYANVDWSSSNADEFFIAWRVYRRLLGDTGVFDLLAEIPNINIKSYHDYMAASNKTYEYVVTQIADRSGDTLESSFPATAVQAFLYSENYWLIDANNSVNTVCLYNVTQDDFTEEYQQEEYIIIGRGRKVDKGTRTGFQGTLSSQMRDRDNITARQQKEALLYLRATATEVFLRNPFGDIYQVSIGSPSFTRIPGVGSAEFVNASLTYSEVS